MPKPSATLAKIPPYLFTALNLKAAAARKNGVDVIHLGIGDPDLPTPSLVVEALQKAAADPAMHNYAGLRGLADFHAAARDWLQSRFGVAVDAEREIVDLIGSKEGLAHIIFAYIQPGDVVLCPSPGYPVYENFTILCGGEPYSVPLRVENGFLPDLDAIPPDIARRAKLLFLNYPNNPTGALATPKFIARALAFCREHDILLCHDNAYSEMTFDGYRAPSFLESDGARDVCVEFFSLSKMYNMTGWRLGFATGNEDALKALGVIKSNADTGSFKAIQAAGAAALRHSDRLLEGVNAIYASRRDLMVEGWRKLGWDYAGNVATFYQWLKAPGGDSLVFADRLLEQCGLVVAPGIGYGPAGEGYFRIALTVPETRLAEALRRMEAAGISGKV